MSELKLVQRVDLTEWTELTKRKPFAHQVEGVEWLVDLVRLDEGRIFPGGLLLADEMRLGKTKQVIDAAHILYAQGDVDTVLVVVPAPVRDVWYDEELGELQKHAWESTSGEVVEYHARSRGWGKAGLRWVITNYEFIRYGMKRTKRGFEGPRLQPLVDRCNPRTLLVLDESSMVSSHKALQTRAVLQLRRRSGRVWLLNGTPMSDSPQDYYSQAMIMDPRILDCRHMTEFMSRYAIMGGFMAEYHGRKIPTQVLGWKHAKREGCCKDVAPSIQVQLHAWDGIGDLQRRLAPYVLRRERKDCMDLPPKLEPVTLTATLTPETWRIYKELREDFAAWLGEKTVVNAAQAGVRAMRLEQVCSGFVGGTETLEEAEPCPNCAGSGLLTDDAPCLDCEGLGYARTWNEDQQVVREVGTEKLDVLTGHVRARLKADAELRMIVWCRFRPEMYRVHAAMEALGVRSLQLCGQQTKAVRKEALRLMHPESVYDGPAVLVGTIGTGSMGLNFSGARETVFSSNSWSYLKRKQSEDRPIGPDQKGAHSYHDIVAVGPKGQRTADHEIIAALRDKQDLSRWTVERWVRLLRED